jgi:hypothetical protein
MSIVTGLALGLLIMVVGALAMTMFGVYLANREKSPRTTEKSVTLARSDALQLIQMIGDLQPIREKLGAILSDHARGNGSSSATD